MAKKEKIQNNNLGKKLMAAPAVMVGSLGLCLMCLVYLNMYDYGENYPNQSVLGAKNATKTKDADSIDINFWNQIVNEYPTYRDGWIRLAVGYYENGEINKAIEALEKAEEIDPNNETVRSLEKIIQR